MESSSQPPLNSDEFKIAIICAFPLECHAVLCSLDENWENNRHLYGKVEGDDNSYDFGRIGTHDVVVLTLPNMGKVAASSSAQSLKLSFKSIKLALLVGVCGAVPFKNDPRDEIVLGDVIIGELIVESDYGQQYHNHFQRKNTVLDVPGRPNEEMLSLLSRWKTDYNRENMKERITKHLESLLQRPRINTVYPGVNEDKLFHQDYIHKHYSGCPECDNPGIVCKEALEASCADLHCDESKLVSRHRLKAEARFNGVSGGIPTPDIHFGRIGTGDFVLKSAQHRDEYAKSDNIIAFEMEGAGIWGKFGCLIIKAVCDYADSHKNKQWQKYAAAVAAAAAKECLKQYVSSSPARESLYNNRPGYSSQMFHSSSGPLIPQDGSATHSSSPKDIFDKTLKDFEGRFGEEKFKSFTSANFGDLRRELKRSRGTKKGQKH